jgi:hypothetical protein
MLADSEIEVKMESQHEDLVDAYHVIGRLAQDAWANPQEVPLPVARLLLHARDYIGRQLFATIIEDEETTHARKIMAPEKS